MLGVITKLLQNYYRDRKLVPVTLQRNRLFPTVERTCQQHRVTAIIPGKLGENVDIFIDGLVFGVVQRELSALGTEYCEAS